MDNNAPKSVQTRFNVIIRIRPIFKEDANEYLLKEDLIVCANRIVL
jgi:hypothetical protein